MPAAYLLLQVLAGFMADEGEFVDIESLLTSQARLRRGLLVGLLAALTLLAWHNRFVQDDAFISYRYAKHLVEGHGLVWNVGEAPVEGYTNFLWTLLIAGLMGIGLDPVTASYMLGVVFLNVTLAMTFLVARRILSSHVSAFVVVALTGTNFTFSAYATGGLETQMQTTLVMSVAALLLAGQTRGRVHLAAASLAGALALMTRLDSAILVCIIGAGGLTSIWRESEGTRKRAASAGWLLWPGAVVLGAWLTWKVAYYGDVLPTTYYVKAATETSLRLGFHYVMAWAVSYFLVAVPVLFAALLPRLFRRAEALHVVTLAVAGGAWALYVTRVGGDFAEFRFLVPVTPMVMIVAGWIAFRGLERSAPAGWGLVALILLGSWHHTYAYRRYVALSGVPPTSRLHEHVYDVSENWAGIGKRLGEIFGQDSEVTIAVGPVGAIPYFSELRTIDMHGLNDRRVAIEGRVLGARPGHQRIAGYNYLVEQGTNLVIGHPVLRDSSFVPPDEWTPEGKPGMGVFYVDDISNLPTGAEMVEIPIADGYTLWMLYLVRHPAVERAIERYGWRTVAIAR